MSGSIGSRIGGFIRRFRGDLTYAIGTLSASAIALAGNFIAAHSISPMEMGIMQTLSLIPVYAGFLHFGVINGLNRDLAICLGKGDAVRVQLLVNGSWSVAKLAAGLGVLMSGMFAVYFAVSDYSSIYLIGMLLVVAALATEPLSQHLEAVYLSTANFRLLGVRLNWQNAVTIVSSVLPLIAGLAGYVASRVIYVMARLAVRCQGVPIKASAAGTIGEIRALASSGFPLLLAGGLYNMMGVADRSVIATMMNPTELGYYTLASLMTAGTQFIPTCLATLLYPRIARCYGQSGSIASLRRYLWAGLGLNIAVLLPVCLVCYYSIPQVCRFLFPEYMPGVDAAQKSCLVSLTFIYYGATGIIATAGRSAVLVFCVLAAAITIWVLGAVLISHGFGLQGVVWARAIGSTGLCLYTILYAYTITTEKK